MSRHTATALGAVTFLATTCTLAACTEFIWIIATLSSPDAAMPDPGSAMPRLVGELLVGMLMAWVLAIVFGVDALRRRRNTATWIAFLLTLPQAAVPVYWWVRVRPRLREQPAT